MHVKVFYSYQLCEWTHKPFHRWEVSNYYILLLIYFQTAVFKCNYLKCSARQEKSRHLHAEMETYTSMCPQACIIHRHSPLKIKLPSYDNIRKLILYCFEHRLSRKLRFWVFECFLWYVFYAHQCCIWLMYKVKAVIL